MIIIINGALGVGKTETSWALLEKFERGVMLDGDYIGAVWPFALADEQRVAYLYQTIAHLIDWHQQHRYPNFVINYVFETAQELAALRRLLTTLDPHIYAFRLVASEAEHEQRVRKRDSTSLEWELHRYRELSEIQSIAAQQGDLGTVIDTSGLSVEQVADTIVAWLWEQERVELVDYDPDWAARYEDEAGRIRQALGGLALDIQHVGSTAVPGLAAKPIVDIMVVTPRLEPGRHYDELLRPLGYRSPDPEDEVNHRFFLRGLPRRFHVHVYPVGSLEIRRHIAFRDALRADPQVREQYLVLKRELSLRHRDDREAYTQAKADFIRSVDSPNQ